MSKYLIEFVGTFFLVLVIALSGDPLAIGAILAAMVYMGGHISGGHYNPAVTVAVLLRGKISARNAAGYLLAQVVGGIAAALVHRLVRGSVFVPSPGVVAGGGVLAPLLIEALLTFALAFVVLQVAASEKTEGNQYYGLAIGFTLMAAAFAGGPISGGVYNPALALGTILVDLRNLVSNLPHLFIYLIGPLVGGFLAGTVSVWIAEEKRWFAAWRR